MLTDPDSHQIMLCVYVNSQIISGVISNLISTIISPNISLYKIPRNIYGNSLYKQNLIYLEKSLDNLVEFYENSTERFSRKRTVASHRTN